MTAAHGTVALLMCLPALAWAQAVVNTDHVRAELVAHAPQGVAPGKPVWLGLWIQHQPHWHTYWKNAGDSGLPTTLSWQLPAGAQAGEIHWPTPHQLPVGPLMNYGYEGDLLLPVAVTVPGGFAAPSFDVKLRADWLVCKEICVPESGEFSLRVPVATGSVAHAERFAAARARMPQALPQAIAKARVQGQTLAIEVEGLPASARGQALKFFPELAGVIDPAAPVQQHWSGARWSATVPLSPQRSESPSRIDAVLVAEPAAGMRIGFDVSGAWPGATGAAAVLAAAPAVTHAGAASLLVSLGLALLGGVLLNLMPCVFPVLSLKVLGFARPGQARRDVVAGGLAYTAGVLLSFIALAGVLLALRAGGEELGWGFQLQSPPFVAALAVLFALMGLNLAGVFELRTVLPGHVAALRARHPVVDHLLTGVLAVAVASPCTGPFMGVALGSALTLPAAQALTVFAALGLGMALPYLAISLVPGLARRLPRPGLWMQHFKVLMAFPMFATVVWLLWVLGQQLGIDAAAGLMGVLLALAFAAWAIGTPGFGRRARWGIGALATLVLVATLAWAWPGLREPSPVMFSAQQTAAARWQPWSPAALAQARAEGRPVFVDFTAAWCVTCQFNKRGALADTGVLADFDAQKVVLLRADWTRRDPAITQELTRLGRSGVPVYALYAAGASQPVVLPEILRTGELRRAIAAMQTGL
jgi:thiol:disulfide interchange protein/DsbC/DsbD-like thiol-disulfide interchange protein